MESVRTPPPPTHTHTHTHARTHTHTQHSHNKGAFTMETSQNYPQGGLSTKYVNGIRSVHI